MLIHPGDPLFLSIDDESRTESIPKSFFSENTQGKP